MELTKILTILFLVSIISTAGTLIYSFTTIQGLQQELARMEDTISLLEEAVGSPELLAGARKEGKLVIYSAMTTEWMLKLIGAFNDVYPFISVEAVRSSPGALQTKFIQESQLGTHIADVVGAGPLNHEQTMKDDLLLNYTPPSAADFPEIWIEENHYYYAFHAPPQIIMVNTDLVPDWETITSYSDLLDPQWDRIAMYLGSGIGPGTYFYAELKEHLGENYFPQLAAQKEILWQPNYQAIVDVVKIGEVPFGFCLSPGNVITAKADGAPVDWLRLSPTVVGPHCLAISANAPHPNAAKLWLDFCLTKPAAIAVAGSPPDYRYFPVYPGVPPGSELFVDMELVQPDWKEDAEAWLAEFKEVFGLA